MRFLTTSLLFSINCFGQLMGKAIRISDGDTFTLLTSDKKQIRIRVYGIDCPENGQDYGQVAKQSTSNLIFKKEVYVQEMDIDKYGRTVGIVFVLPDSINLNEELLKAGLAWQYTRYDKNPKWAEMEKNAIIERKGLWKPKDAIPPWEYRRNKPRN